MRSAIHTFILIVVFIQLFTFCYAILPEVTNSSAVQRTDGSKIVDIYYDISCETQTTVYISLVVSNDNGTTFMITPKKVNLSGDCGKKTFAQGLSQHSIQWNAGNESRKFDGSGFKFKVQVWNKIPIPPNFVLVEGGTINNGLYNVDIGTFYIDMYELTQKEYSKIMGHNPVNDYPMDVHGTGDFYPVYYVSWYNAIEYCNRRSINEDLIPCYSYTTYGTDPANWPIGWNTNVSNHTNISCDWTEANGYRLPTEMEWMYTARGGNQTTHNYTYSGSDNVNDVAWYGSYPPADGGGNSDMTTHIVGGKLANELGIFDMSGNIWEWCWDQWDRLSPYVDAPYGSGSGGFRISRGGCWKYSPRFCAITIRSGDTIYPGNRSIGFRVCRNYQNFTSRF